MDDAYFEEVDEFMEPEGNADLGKFTSMAKLANTGIGK
jgi:hypothetical protein